MTQRKRGRKAGDFTIKVQGETHRIPYRVVENDSEEGYDEEVFVDIDEPVKLKLTAETRKELRDLVAAELESVLAIEFSSVIRVRTMRANYTEPNNSSHVLPGRILGLSHDFLEVGVRSDGRKVWRYPRSSEVKDGEPFQGDNDISYAHFGAGKKNERIEAHSIIPDTEENRRKLDELHAAMTVLSERFSEAFSPERIEQTLLQSNPGQLLLGS
jgi:hypothetical protein